MINILYIDPSVMTYSIQIITGVTITIGASLGLLIKRIRKKANIKEKKKETETDDIKIK